MDRPVASFSQYGEGN